MKQTEALEILKMGKNVFLTGAAGSGKTYVLNSYINFLKERGVEVAITASTGIAATHIGGMTIHSWAGIGIKDFLTDRDLDHMQQKQYLWKRFDKVKVLVIDEVSMLKDSALDMVDAVCKAFKRSDLPFGGIQVLISGDFFQLPPIDKALNIKTVKKNVLNLGDMSYEMDEDGFTSSTPFAFKSNAWRKADLHTCYLREQYRQNEGGLLSILEEIRSGEVSDDAREMLLERICVEEKDVTKLFTHNMDVDRFNQEKLSKVKGEEKVFEMTTRGKVNLVQSIQKGCLAPVVLRLRIGSKVMFVKNNPVQGYVNGTIGEVIKFKDGFPLVQTLEGKEFLAQPQSWSIEEQGAVLAEVSQVPLRLAWAVTIHKSQGMTLDEAYIDLSNAFAPGQGYVALSRIRDLEGLFLKGINRAALEVHPEILIFDDKLKRDSDVYVSRLEKTDDMKIKQYQDEFLKTIGGEFKVAKEEGDKSTYEKTLDLVKVKKQ